MKKLCVIAALVASAFLVAPAPVASAATPGCVTKAEYQKVKKGTPKTKVAKTFGTAGKRISIASSGGFSSEIRSYKTCSKYSVVSIAFDKVPGGVFKLSAKSAVWVG